MLRYGVLENKEWVRALIKKKKKLRTKVAAKIYSSGVWDIFRFIFKEATLL